MARVARGCAMAIVAGFAVAALAAAVALYHHLNRPRPATAPRPQALLIVPAGSTVAPAASGPSSNFLNF